MKIRPMHNAAPYGFNSPGAGPVDTTHSPKRAAANVKAWVADVVAAGHVVDSWEPIVDPDPESLEGKLLMGGTKYSKAHDGRYPFRIFVDGRRHVLEMPGITLKNVRCLKGDNMWDFPRVFIDGSSWIWYIGLDVMTDPGMTNPWEATSP